MSSGARPFADKFLGPAPSELKVALAAFNRAFGGVAVISGMNNVLMLTGAFFMLEIYDRVLPSRSVPTLVGFIVLATLLYFLLGALDVIRSRVLVRIGAAMDQSLSSRVLDAVVRLPLKTRGGGDGLQPLRDLDTIRTFLSGGGPPALFDLPWMPLYLGICYYFHFAIGFIATLGALILVAITFVTERLTRGPSREALQFAIKRNGLAQAARRNAEVVHAMGMAPSVGAIWADDNRKYLASQERASDVSGGLGAVSRVLRLLVQSALLGAGAYLAIEQQASSGVIIAGSIIGTRALAPIDTAIANWRPFVAARQGWERLHQLLVLMPVAELPTPLARPKAVLQVEGVSVGAPGETRLFVQDVSFTLRSGQALGIIGPTASGKSTLVRAIVGVWTPGRGKVRLDGGALDQWAPHELGRHLGYLPQDVEMFDGTVAQNIARFTPDPDPNLMIAAAEAAGVHELVLRLPEGYETRIGEAGTALSAGQSQRIALARALYGDPFLVVLDEPNSNLDTAGEQALTQAIMRVRARGGIAIVVAHRPNVLTAVDQVLVMLDGRVHMIGPKDEILAKVMQPQPAQAPATTPLPEHRVAALAERQRGAG